MERDEVERAVREAFAGVRLGAGTSLRQAAAIDRDLLADVEWDEVVDDWSRIPEAELRGDNVAHLDAEGLRYYLPALMLWLLDHYAAWGELFVYRRAFFTLCALAPVDPQPESYARYDAFTDAQRAAVARFVEALPRLLDLDPQDAMLLERSIADYWGQFLPDGR